MQLDADRYPLLYSLRGALSPARKNAKAARQAAAKRRAWTAEYSQLVFSLIDARREAEALREAGAPKAAVDAAAEARWAIEKRVHERFPGLLSRDSGGHGTYVSRDDDHAREPSSPTSPLDRTAPPDDAVQMAKDFAREAVIVGGVEVQGGDLEAKVRDHCSGLRAIDDKSDVFPPQRPEAAQALATAALRAVWRTRVGLDAWARARKHLEQRRAADAATEAQVAEVLSSTSSRAPSLCGDGSTVQASDDDEYSDLEDHALVSRPTEPPTTIDAFVDGRVVCTAYSHLSEVRCDDTGERSFMHVAVRTTFKFSAADGIDLSTERDVLFVALDEQKRERALEEATVTPSRHSWFGGAPQKKRTFAVSVPEGAGPGSRLRVRAPTTGQDMTVTVPAGVASGGLFDVPLPEPRLPSLGE
ncbi:unnamed protein product [Pelagomonas calceolata]|uniref:Uncharacterized protein n=1 Tax=Pelagomonas calceolata TaxID=35677 RepID=A0A8J2SM79_9STRA|nr:unnamed protein product [Pelagomonas calceolata]